ncbi:unnamed protein product [Cyprideis torosa]|uniref:Gamma-aminobutyric acid receptor subunit beta n=1 Tax=Cyprideis torosa TaxID=163714 RepID=A0A7R8W7X8_9CRUS|nr:unnamed protein product [Cyprideis torosa]CAG0888026.1 unnamed protein product [Cyprideis torosa]
MLPIQWLPSAVLLSALCHRDSSSTWTAPLSAELGSMQPIEDVNITNLLDGLQKGYDKRIRPNYGGPPVDVGVTMYVLSISSLSEVEMDFTLDFYFRQYWHDRRLAYSDFLENSGASKASKEHLKSFTVGAELIKKLWVPDTFFVNEKKSYFHYATTPNEFLRLSEDGSVFRSIRLTITAACPMDLRYFPMDRQMCAVEIESFGYTTTDIMYAWIGKSDAVKVDNDVRLPQFKVLGFRQSDRVFVLSSGNYSRLSCEIQFVRSMGYYLIQIYIPSGLIVVISWVSFWLNRNATPARVALGITTVLTMTTLMSSTNAALPKISYAKSIDVYLGACFVMVFASLLVWEAEGAAEPKEEQEEEEKILGRDDDDYGGREKQLKEFRLFNHVSLLIFGSEMFLLLSLPCCFNEGRSTDRMKEPEVRKYATVGYIAKRIQMRKTRILAMQKFAEQKRQQREIAQSQMVAAPWQSHGPPPHEPSCHMMEQEWTPKPSTMRSRAQSGTWGETSSGPCCPPRECGMDQEWAPKQAEVRYKINDPKMHTKGGTLENTTLNGGRSRNRLGIEMHPMDDVESVPPTSTVPHLPLHQRSLDKFYGLTPSDIDKYSRVVFPVCFVCFNLMYWIIYLHISDVVAENLTMFNNPS